MLAVSIPATSADPIVDQGRVTFRLADPGDGLAGVRLFTDRGFPATRDRFAREGDGWALTIDAPALDRFEYAFELELEGGGSALVTDDANPRRAPGAFGEKSVVELPGYAAPAWLDASRANGRTDGLTVASSTMGADVDVAVWRPEDAPDGEPLDLLVAHDGPELDALARLTGYAASQIAVGRLPRHRVALLAPGERDQWYSASALYARTLATQVMPAIGNAVAVRRVGRHGREPRRAGDAPRPPPLPRAVQRPVPAVRELLRASLRRPGGGLRALPARSCATCARCCASARASRCRSSLTCGALEENVHNNRLMARALAARGWPAALHEGRDLHNFTAWRDVFDPISPRCFAEVWLP